MSASGWRLAPVWRETRSLQPVWRWERRYPVDTPVFGEHVVVAELALKGLRTRGG
jgi:hypothetical protein